MLEVLASVEVMLSRDESDESKAAALCVKAMLESRLVCGSDYFGRVSVPWRDETRPPCASADSGFVLRVFPPAQVWTLAERMARCDRRESLRAWLSLRSWLGMLVDALGSVAASSAAAAAVFR